jgi:hypothetical protein
MSRGDGRQCPHSNLKPPPSPNVLVYLTPRTCQRHPTLCSIAPTATPSAARSSWSRRIRSSGLGRLSTLNFSFPRSQNGYRLSTATERSIPVIQHLILMLQDASCLIMPVPGPAEPAAEHEISLAGSEDQVGTGRNWNRPSQQDGARRITLPRAQKPRSATSSPPNTPAIACRRLSTLNSAQFPKRL